MASLVDERHYNQGFKPCPALTERTRRRARYIVAANGMTAGMQALEIGCGDGEMLHEVAKASGAFVLGIDRSAKFIALAQSQYGTAQNVAFQSADFTPEAMQTYARHFDCLYGNGILHHLMPDLPLHLLRMKQLLKPGGRVCFIEPNLWNPYVYLVFSYAPLRRMAKLEPTEMTFSAPSIAAIFKECGFNNIVVECRDFLLPNTPRHLIRPVVRLGDWLEQTPLRFIAQSLFISASV